MSRHGARQIPLLIAAFVIGAAIAAVLGADNAGIALGVGQLTFAATLVAVLLRG